MIHSHKEKKLLFMEPEYIETIPISQKEFIPIFDSIYLELEPQKQRGYGLIAGSEGLGCQFFADDQSCLYAMELELKPFEIVDIPPTKILVPIIKSINSQSKPGIIRFKTYPFSPINPDAAWLLSSFGTVLFSFDGIIIEPPYKFVEQSNEIEFVRIDQGTVVGLERKTGLLKLILLENFNQVQKIDELEISVEKCGVELVNYLNSIQLHFFDNLEPAKFEKSSQKFISLIRSLEVPNTSKEEEWEQIKVKINKLVEIYKNSLKYYNLLF